jgi:hypothetical protein
MTATTNQPDLRARMEKRGTHVTNPAQFAVNEFIEIPAQNVWGCIFEIEPAMVGSDDARRVLLQENPEDEDGTWYTLEPGDAKLL